MATEYSYSRDGDNYHHGTYDTVEAACDEAAADIGVGRHFWVGENVPPRQPEEFFDAETWLENVSDQDEYAGDYADDWDRSTDAQQKELEAEVRRVMAAWLDRHKLRPSFWTIKNERKFYVAGKVGEVYEIEAV